MYVYPSMYASAFRQYILNIGMYINEKINLSEFIVDEDFNSIHLINSRIGTIKIIAQAMSVRICIILFFQLYYFNWS